MLKTVVRCSLCALALVVLASTVQAQETYSVPATAQQVVDLTNIVSVDNARTCIRANDIAVAAGRSAVPLACTQAQACTGVAAAGGASCTAAQARAANARIFPLTQAGREEYVQFQLVAVQFNMLKSSGFASGAYRKFACCQWETFTPTQKNQICSDYGLPSGCELTCNFGQSTD